MNNKTLTSVSQSLSTERVILSCVLFLLSVTSALAEVTGQRVQLGHYGIPGSAHDYVPPFENGTSARTYLYGSSSAAAGPGTLSLTARYTSPQLGGYGDADLRLNAYFADTVTIDAPGRTGQAGTFTVAYLFDGSYDANDYAYNTATLSCVFGMDAGDGIIPGMGNTPANAFKYRGDDTYSMFDSGTFFLGVEQTETLAFTYGQPFDFWLKLGALLHVVETEKGDAHLAVSLVKWSGLTDIKASGVPVLDATVISVSGTNWTQAVSSSLPSNTNLMQIAQIELTPTSIIFNGTNGAANGPFHILSSTDLSLPSGEWPAIFTNRYTTSGTFNVTLPIVTEETQRFFRVH